MSEVFIFGVSGEELPKEQLRKIASCSAVVVSSRHQPLLKGMEIHRIPIAPVEEMVFELAVALNQGDVAILASGDPLFSVLVARYWNVSGMNGFIFIQPCLRCSWPAPVSSCHGMICP